MNYIEEYIVDSQTLKRGQNPCSTYTSKTHNFYLLIVSH